MADDLLYFRVRELRDRGVTFQIVGNEVGIDLAGPRQAIEEAQRLRSTCGQEIKAILAAERELDADHLLYVRNLFETGRITK